MSHDTPTPALRESRRPDGDGQFSSETRANRVDREVCADALDTLATREASLQSVMSRATDGDAERRCVLSGAAERLVKSGRGRSGQLIDGQCVNSGENSAQSGNPKDDVRAETQVAGSEPADSRSLPSAPVASAPKAHKEAICGYCGEDIRLDTDDRWEDRDTGHSCENGPNADKPHMPQPRDLVALLILAVRDADQSFQRSGGSSRHWVNECFMPSLEKHGLIVCERKDR